MAMQVTPLTETLAAEITGVDLTQPLDDAQKRELHRLFVENAVVVFRDQLFTPQQFAAAAQIFGEIIPEQFPNYRLPEFPTVRAESGQVRAYPALAKKLAHSSGLKRSSRVPMRGQRVSSVRSWALRRWALSFEKACSIGLRSGE